MNLGGLWQGLGAAFTALMLVGAFVAAGGSRTGAWLLLAALAGLLLSHLTISVVAYRRTMASLWPQVEPVADDDWD